MAIESRETVIGGTTYQVAQLPAKKGTALMVRLVKLLGPGVGSFVGGVGRSGSDEFDSALASGVGEAVHDFAARITEPEVAAILEEFARNTTVVKSEEIHLRLSDVYDDHFAGAYDELLAWARFCMEINFRSFFVARSGANNRLLGRLLKMVQASLFRTTSSGTSTESPQVPATPQA